MHWHEAPVVPYRAPKRANELHSRRLMSFKK